MRLRKPPAARTTRLRTKITAVLVSLALLWAFAAWVTVRDGWNLQQAAERDAKAGRPTKTLINALQEERRLSSVSLAGTPGVPSPELVRQRARTDQVIGQWRRLTGQAPGDLGRPLADTRRALDGMGSMRSAIDRGTIDRTLMAETFNTVIDHAFRIAWLTAEIDDEDIAAAGRALISLTRARELMARQDAFMAGALRQTRFGTPEMVRFAQLAGGQRAGLDETRLLMAQTDPGRYGQLTRGPAYTQFRGLEDRLLGWRPRTPSRPPVTAAQWQAAVSPVLTEIDRTIDASGDALVERAKPMGYWVLARLVLAGVFGLLAVIASIVLAFSTARNIVRQLTRLRVAAQDLADRRLPEVMVRLSRGEQVDVAAEVPGLEFGSDEIGQVGQAFNRVQLAAVQAAVQQAQQRAGFRATLLNLAQRQRGLGNQQMALLDRIERRSDLQGEFLKDVFALDHLTTRGQRTSENLIQIAGGQPTRAARRAVLLFDVARSAVGQVEQYERVVVHPMDPYWLSGRAIDVTRLLAELIENALTCSAPNTKVEIAAERTGTGVAVTIDDKGLGLKAEQLAHANKILADPPPFDQQPGTQLGLFVVGLIARRHGIRCSLKTSPYGGITAVVLLPDALLDEEPAGEGPVLTHADTSDAIPIVDGPPAGTRETNVALLHPVQTPTETVRPGPSERQRAEEEPAPDAPEGEGGQTSGGLPIRVRQNNLVPELREAVAEEGAETPEPDDGRSPEEIRRIMSAYQDGTRAGRSQGSDGPEAIGPGSGHESDDDHSTGPEDR
ncbi:nitrate- and nitrite sensing domain-containing protein [Spirillospora sp. CA-294931]|uniref:sensor histidine kinase n=1 Tax=Spirillospora sp. CA-294931 TaxID=3240042 RepID=UPI003D90F35D